MIVVDASLATKWLLGEPDSAQAVAFLHANIGNICGPDLLAIEVGRALIAAANARRIEVAAARQALAAWFEKLESGILLHRCNPAQIEHAASLALDLGHPLADYIYLVLAIDLGINLATCDEKFHARLAGRFSMVKLLAELA